MIRKSGLIAIKKERNVKFNSNFEIITKSQSIV